ncbi:MAG: hypothetical protein MRERV_17c010 [Mycoplasmataceae bacterium RV_VA103A]|nr:MAG: hypothetical protein MRERV_22c041 [Mycoplasmataceae bacterium RV_VA103A]KLL04575.1 MAG: hypothetical protein MRERV_17c010 [Mycoplasmataceae bacterium RV_VA103A]
MYKEKIIELKRKLEETEERLREYQKRKEFDNETISLAKKLIVDYQEIVKRYDDLLSEERKAHFQTLEKWKEDSEMNSKINRKFIESLKRDMEEIKKGTCEECREKFKKLLGDKEDESTKN